MGWDSYSSIVVAIALLQYKPYINFKHVHSTEWISVMKIGGMRNAHEESEM